MKASIYNYIEISQINTTFYLRIFTSPWALPLDWLYSYTNWNHHKKISRLPQIATNWISFSPLLTAGLTRKDGQTKWNNGYLCYFYWNETCVCSITGSASARRWEVMGSILGPNRVIAKYVKSCIYCCYVRCATLIVWEEGMPWPKTGATQYHAQLGLQNKGRAINRAGWLSAIVGI